MTQPLVLAFLVSPLAAWAVVFVVVLFSRAVSAGGDVLGFLRIFFYVALMSYPATILLGGPLVLWMARAGLATAWSVIGVGALVASTPLLVREVVSLLSPRGLQLPSPQEMVAAAIITACGIAVAGTFWIIAGRALKERAAEGLNTQRRSAT